MCIHTYIHTHYIYIHTYVLPTYMHTHAHTHIHTYKHTYKHKHLQTYTPRYMSLTDSFSCVTYNSLSPPPLSSLLILSLSLSRARSLFLSLPLSPPLSPPLPLSLSALPKLLWTLKDRDSKLSLESLEILADLCRREHPHMQVD